MHDCFAGARAEGGVELVAVVEGEVVPGEGLAAVFVDSLEDLLGGGVLVSYRHSSFLPERELRDLFVAWVCDICITL